MKGAIAQLVVRRADNAKVPGSKPGSTNSFLPPTFFKKVYVFKKGYALVGRRCKFYFKPLLHIGSMCHELYNGVL